MLGAIRCGARTSAGRVGVGSPEKIVARSRTPAISGAKSPYLRAKGPRRGAPRVLARFLSDVTLFALPGYRHQTTTRAMGVPR